MTDATPAPTLVSMRFVRRILPLFLVALACDRASTVIIVLPPVGAPDSGVEPDEPDETTGDTTGEVDTTGDTSDEIGRRVAERAETTDESTSSGMTEDGGSTSSSTGDDTSTGGDISIGTGTGTTTTGEPVPCTCPEDGACVGPEDGMCGDDPCDALDVFCEASALQSAQCKQLHYQCTQGKGVALCDIVEGWTGPQDAAACVCAIECGQ